MMTRWLLRSWVLMMATSVAGGAVVNIDFQGVGDRTAQGGRAVIPFEGSYWNSNGQNGVAMSLLTSAGEASGVELIPQLFALGQTGEGDALFQDSTFGEVTLRGLNPGQDYQIVLYGGANLESIFRVAQPFDNDSPAYGEIVCDYRHTALPGIEGCDYVTGMVVADAAGEITVGASPGVMGGMQINLNPEPSVTMLSLLAGLGILLRRRR